MNRVLSTLAAFARRHPIVALAWCVGMACELAALALIIPAARTLASGRVGPNTVLSLIGGFGQLGFMCILPALWASTRLDHHTHGWLLARTGRPAVASPRTVQFLARLQRNVRILGIGWTLLLCLAVAHLALAFTPSADINLFLGLILSLLGLVAIMLIAAFYGLPPMAGTDV